MSLDYFRRPLLAGKNLPRTTSAVLRGSVRRSNPANGITVPHFPGVTAGMTVQVKFEDGVTLEATLTSNGYQQILDDINTAIAAKGRAFDSDGCVAIQTLVAGGLGSVEVVGGDGAAFIGFDMKAGVPLRAVGGELASVSEGRNGSAFGTVFPPKNESLTSDSFRIAMGRLAGNMDLLHADLSRRQAQFTKVGDIATGAQTVPFGASSNYGLLTVPANPGIFTGYGLLSRLSTKEDLAPFYVLVDKKTGQPAASRVVAVVKGNVVPAFTNGVLNPPADATTSDGTGNVLGLLNPRFAPATGITAIKNGRIIQAAAGTYAKVRVGDWVKIDGVDATINKDPWDNRGLRWVVEEVIDTDTVAVRPMSPPELALAGTVVKDEQPILELNDQKTGVQVWGTVQVFAGTFIDDPKLVVSPPISDTVELWAAVSKSYRDLTQREGAYASALFAKMLMGDQADLPDSLLTLPTLTMSGTAGQADRVITLGEAYLRWKGRVVRFGGGAINVGVSRAVDVWVYLDKTFLTLNIAAGAGGAVTAYSNIPVAYFPPGNQTAPNPIGRVQETQAQSVFVGTGGHFASLTDAIEWFHQASSAGVPQHELVVTSNQTAPAGGWTIKKNGLQIRGASPAILLSRANGDVGNLFTLDQSVVSRFHLTGFVVEDLTKIWGTTGAGATPTVFLSTISNATMSAYGVYSSGSYELSNNGANVYLRALQGKNLDLGDVANDVYIGKNDVLRYTYIRSKLKANRISELFGGLIVGDTATGAGDSTFYGNVTVGKVGQTKALNVIGSLSVTGNVSLGTAGTTLETLAKLVAKLGIDVGTAASPQDLQVYGNATFGTVAAPKAVTVNGTTNVTGTATFRDDIDAFTSSPVGKGVVKSRTLQVAGATGTNVDATGKLTVGGAGKGYLATDGEIGNANAKIDATGKVIGKTAEIAGVNGTSVDGNGNLQVGGANKARLGTDGSVKGNSLIAQDAAGAAQATISGTDGSASFKKQVAVSTATAAAGAKVLDLGTAASVTKEGDLTFGRYLLAKGKKLFDVMTDHPAVGFLNPLTILRGRRIFFDEEFSKGVDGATSTSTGTQVVPGFSIYNNQGNANLKHTVVTNALPPNKTGKAVKVEALAAPVGTGTLGNYGGFNFTAGPTARPNSAFAVIFKAKAPTGTHFTLHNNALGTGAKIYWLTDNVGTDKWEEYIGVWEAGEVSASNPAWGTACHVALNQTDTGVAIVLPRVWHVASATMYDITDLTALQSAAEVSAVAGAANTDTNGKITVQEQLDALNTSNRIKIADARNTPSSPDSLVRDFRVDLRGKVAAGLPSTVGEFSDNSQYGDVIGVGGWPDNGAGYDHEIALSKGAPGGVYLRRGNKGSGGSWDPWRKFAVHETDGSLAVHAPNVWAGSKDRAVRMDFLPKFFWGIQNPQAVMIPGRTYTYAAQINSESGTLWRIGGGNQGDAWTASGEPTSHANMPINMGFDIDGNVTNTLRINIDLRAYDSCLMFGLWINGALILPYSAHWGDIQAGGHPVGVYTGGNYSSYGNDDWNSYEFDVQINPGINTIALYNRLLHTAGSQGGGIMTWGYVSRFQMQMTLLGNTTPALANWNMT